MCKNKQITPFLDLGFHPPSDNFLTKKQLIEPETLFPLIVSICENCGLCQLDYIVSPELMYNENYPYETSMNNVGVKHFKKMAQDICEKFNFEKNSLVIDIGSNVGVLLSGFKECGMNILGIEPSKNICEKANKIGIDSIHDFFSSSLAKDILNSKGQASIITGTNVFAHIDDLEDFIKAIDILLEKNGVVIIEAPYLQDMIDKLEYDTIYHEHLSYISLKPMVMFFENHGMQVFDVEHQPIHGGSLRYFICRTGVRKISSDINNLLKSEEKNGLHSIENLKKFSESVKKHRLELLNLLFDLKKNDQKIIGISAPAKGNTLLNFCKIGTEYLDYITEKSMLKIGKYTPGSHIKIFSDDVLLKDKPNYALILAWNFAEDIMMKNSNFKKNGGKFIIPIPHPKII